MGLGRGALLGLQPVELGVAAVEFQKLLMRALLGDAAGLDGNDAKEILDGLAAEMDVSKAELIRTIVTEWLIANAYLPVFTIDEGCTTDGNG
ncbi:hypothetical protein B5V01_07760 [Mesorhizobium erdmanii]|uniref:Ribbon-helix-helix protein CopG domain-containing protein n=2 Tax=Mesorhizobium TaxID=68287 RepID=A0A4Q1V7S0_9HYPH|nr:hypothetical protein B5V01_07760 [Mesorhizobium erdmanii]